MKFTKMHGCGNDFIVINSFKEEVKLTRENIIFLCKPHFGIGSDGILFVLPSKVADFRMKMFNVDGTEAEMCGNGTRCIAKFAYDEKIISKTKATIETEAGIKYVELILDKKEVISVKVNMGKADFLQNPAREFDLQCVSIGNPHAVMVVDNVDKFPVCEIGYKVENHKGFPKKTNVEFAEIISKNIIKIRIWERSCGETFSCGTGSCATFAVLNKLGVIDDKCILKLRGGDLEIQLINNEIFMTGSAVNVFDGNIKI
ncbi:MAG TPA: diaminopimelate epimerase [Rickettsiales bacterium]|nr:diaminopimelate epimerase [Rickettsiales bacterium]